MLRKPPASSHRIPASAHESARTPCPRRDPVCLGTQRCDCPFVHPSVPCWAPCYAYRLRRDFVRLSDAMGALAMRQLDQLLELRAMGHAGANRRRSQSGSMTTMQTAILGLQRTAGNQAVASLMAVQRCGGSPCDCDHHEPEATQVQRDGSDAGDVPAQTGSSCYSFTSFADDFLGTAPKSPFFAMTSFNFAARDGKVAVDEDKAGSWVNRRKVAGTRRPGPPPAAGHGRP